MQPDPTAGSPPTLVIVERPGVVHDALEFVLAGTFTTLRQDPADAPGSAVLSAVLAAEPDVVLLSFGAVSRPDAGRLIGQLRARRVPVVAIAASAMQEDRDTMRRWTDAGAAAVVPADSALPTLVEALTRAARRPAGLERADARPPIEQRRRGEG